MLIYEDGTDTLYDHNGNAVAQVPPAQLPSGEEYVTIGVDVAHFRSLLGYGPAGFINAVNTDQNQATSMAYGYAVRDLLTGAIITNYDMNTLACNPSLGNNGSTFDGYQLINEVPSAGLQYSGARLCWINWNVIEAGLAQEAAGQVPDFSQFVTPHVFSNGNSSKTNASHQLGFGDSINAMDGSLARILIVNEQPASPGIQTQTVFTYHPNIRPFYDVDELHLSIPPSPLADTGAGGTLMIVRDLDGGAIERWTYGSSGVHVQNLMMDLFNLPGTSPQLIELSPQMPLGRNAAPFVDTANNAQDLGAPGRILINQYLFTPSTSGADLQAEGWGDLNPAAGDNAIAISSNLNTLIGNSYQVLVPWDQLTNPSASNGQGSVSATAPAPQYLPAGFIETPDGTLYYSDGAGHYCGFASWSEYRIDGGRADQSNVTSVDGIPASYIYDGICQVVIPAGRIETSDGTIYYSSGNGHVCAYASWGEYLIGGGAADQSNVTQIGALTSATVYDGVCSVYLGPGYVRTADGTIYYSNGGGHVCAYQDWSDYLVNGGAADLSNVTEIGNLTQATVYDGVCQIILPAGFFIVSNGSIYWSNGTGDVCAYRSWNAFLNGGGAADLSNVTSIGHIPAGTQKDGVCQ